MDFKELERLEWLWSKASHDKLGLKLIEGNWQVVSGGQEKQWTEWDLMLIVDSLNAMPEILKTLRQQLADKNRAVIDWSSIDNMDLDEEMTPVTRDSEFWRKYQGW